MKKRLPPWIQVVEGCNPALKDLALEAVGEPELLEDDQGELEAHEFDDDCECSDCHETREARKDREFDEKAALGYR